MKKLEGRVAIVTGASSGVGRGLAKVLAENGAKICACARRVEKLEELKAEVEGFGGEVLPVACDVTDVEQINHVVVQCVERFGGIDICVNNASAIALTPIEQTDIKRFDLMFAVNTRGTFLVSQTCLPHLRKAKNPHILMLSPPLDMKPQWFSGHVAYSIAKYGMSLCVLGLADELKKDGIAVNALWPRTAIATAAVRNILGGDKMMRMSRSPEIVADAAHLVFQQPAKSFSGNFLIDDTFLHSVGGITDFEKYRVYPSVPLAPDFFVPADSRPPPGVNIARVSEMG